MDTPELPRELGRSCWPVSTSRQTEAIQDHTFIDRDVELIGCQQKSAKQYRVLGQNASLTSSMATAPRRTGLAPSSYSTRDEALVNSLRDSTSGTGQNQAYQAIRESQDCVHGHLIQPGSSNRSSSGTSSHSAASYGCSSRNSSISRDSTIQGSGNETGGTVIACPVPACSQPGTASTAVRRPGAARPPTRHFRRASEGQLDILFSAAPSRLMPAPGPSPRQDICEQEPNTTSEARKKDSEKESFKKGNIFRQLADARVSAARAARAYRHSRGASEGQLNFVFGAMDSAVDHSNTANGNPDVSWTLQSDSQESPVCLVSGGGHCPPQYMKEVTSLDLVVTTSLKTNVIPIVPNLRRLQLPDESDSLHSSISTSPASPSPAVSSVKATKGSELNAFHPPFRSPPSTMLHPQYLAPPSQLVVYGSRSRSPSPKSNLRLRIPPHAKVNPSQLSVDPSLMPGGETVYERSAGRRPPPSPQPAITASLHTQVHSSTARSGFPKSSSSPGSPVEECLGGSSSFVGASGNGRVPHMESLKGKLVVNLQRENMMRLRREAGQQRREKLGGRSTPGSPASSDQLMDGCVSLPGSPGFQELCREGRGTPGSWRNRESKSPRSPCSPFRVSEESSGEVLERFSRGTSADGGRRPDKGVCNSAPGRRCSQGHKASSNMDASHDGIGSVPVDTGKAARLNVKKLVGPIVTPPNAEVQEKMLQSLGSRDPDSLGFYPQGEVCMEDGEDEEGAPISAGSKEGASRGMLPGNRNSEHSRQERNLKGQTLSTILSASAEEVSPGAATSSLPPLGMRLHPDDMNEARSTSSHDCVSLTRQGAVRSRANDVGGDNVAAIDRTLPSAGHKHNRVGGDGNRRRRGGGRPRHMRGVSVDFALSNASESFLETADFQMSSSYWEGNNASSASTSLARSRMLSRDEMLHRRGSRFGTGCEAKQERHGDTCREANTPSGNGSSPLASIVQKLRRHLEDSPRVPSDVGVPETNKQVHGLVQAETRAGVARSSSQGKSEHRSTHLRNKARASGRGHSRLTVGGGANALSRFHEQVKNSSISREYTSRPEDVQGVEGTVTEGALDSKRSPLLLELSLAYGYRQDLNLSDHVLRKGYENVYRCYAIENKEIASGQFGKIRRCREIATGKVCAVKTISKAHIKYKEAADDVRKEVACLALLEGHDSIIKLIRTFEDHANIHLIMELYCGGDLHDHVSQYGCLSEPDAARVCYDLVQALVHCHKNGIVHRDVKPENILLVQPKKLEQVKLADFGVATFFRPGVDIVAVAGTLEYMAPEVLKERYGPESDVWSLGGLLHFLMSGLPPFWESSPAKVHNAILNSSVSLRSSRWSHVSEDCKEIIRMMLHKDPSARITPQQILEHPWMLKSLAKPL